jgi:antibiotic biosynthesis monooxygenase (ABM) superfamily enzyme
MTEPLRGREKYLDELEPPPPPRWRLVVGGLACLVLPAIVVVGAKWLVFPDMSIADFAIRSLIAGTGIALLWIAFFRRRLGN